MSLREIPNGNSNRVAANRANPGMVRGTPLGAMADIAFNIPEVNLRFALFDNRVYNYYDNRQIIIQQPARKNKNSDCDTESSDDDEQCKCKCDCKKQHKKRQNSGKSRKADSEEISAVVREFMQAKMRGNSSGRQAS